MPTIDAHQHFWDPATAHYPWMGRAPEVLRRRFAPEDLAPLAAAAGVDRTVFVQARSELAETREFLRLAAGSDLVAGVVGWLDLTDPGVADVIAELREGPGGSAFVGVRHQVEEEEDLEWLLRPEVQRGIAAVGQAGLVYDLLVRPPHLPAALKTVSALPECRFAVDHLAKPLLRTGELEPWAAQMAELAAFANVSCKISGMVAEADPESWSAAQFEPYVAHVLECFGPERLMFGSDWPVCLVAASYQETVDSTRAALPALSAAETERIFGGTAVEIYGLTA
jgi:L-fuconolactonase